LRKIHFDQFVDRQWHPHPSKAFTRWWKHHPNCTTVGYETHRTQNNAIVAFNCACYYDQFCDARNDGTLDERPIETNGEWRTRKGQDDRGYFIETAVEVLTPELNEPEQLEDIGGA